MPDEEQFTTIYLPAFVTLEQHEREYIEQVIKACGGNVLSASKILGIDASTIYRKRERWKKQETPAS